MLRPVTDAPAIWDQICRYRDVLASDDDYDALHAHIRQQTQRTLLGIEHILQDFAQRQRAARALPWVEGQDFTLTVRNGDAAHGLTMPQRSHRGLDAIQLAIAYERKHVSIEETQDVAQRIRLFLQQGNSQILLADGLPWARSAVRGGDSIRCNWLAKSPLQFDRPFSVLLLCERPPVGLNLRCRFRLRLASPARRQSTPKRAGEAPMP